MQEFSVVQYKDTLEDDHQKEIFLVHRTMTIKVEDQLYWISGVQHTMVPIHETMVFYAKDDSNNPSDWTEVYCERGTTDILSVAVRFANFLREKENA